jgi:hypothetical protein
LYFFYRVLVLILDPPIYFFNPVPTTPLDDAVGPDLESASV